MPDGFGGPSALGGVVFIVPVDIAGPLVSGGGSIVGAVVDISGGGTSSVVDMVGVGGEPVFDIVGVDVGGVIVVIVGGVVAVMVVVGVPTGGVIVVVGVPIGGVVVVVIVGGVVAEAVDDGMLPAPPTPRFVLSVSFVSEEQPASATAPRTARPTSDVRARNAVRADGMSAEEAGVSSF